MTQTILAPIDAELSRDMVHVILKRPVHGDATDAAHGACRRRIGVNQPADGAKFADAVVDRAAVERERGQIGHLTGVRAVVHIGDDVARQDISVSVERRSHLDIHAVAAGGCR